MILGGSTNAVLHLIAIAKSVGITLTIDDFQAVSDRTPFIADLKPSGKYVMEDVYKIGGIPRKPHDHSQQCRISVLIKLNRGSSLSTQK